MDIDKELDVNFYLLEKSYKTLKEKLIKYDIDIYTFSKLKDLSSNFEWFINNIDDTIVSLDICKCKLTDEDIDRINCNLKINDLFKTFLPLMIAYSLCENT